MNLKFLKARLAAEPDETQPEQKYIFLVKSQELAMNLVLAGFAAVSIGNDGVSIRDFHEMIRNLEPGKTNAIRHLYSEYNCKSPYSVPIIISFFLFHITKPPVYVVYTNRILQERLFVKYCECRSIETVCQ